MRISDNVLCEGARIPRFYGLAWRDHARCEVVVYPMPINWLAWALREVFYRLKQTPKTREDKAYSLGHRAGTRYMNDNIEDAKREAYSRGAAAVVLTLEQQLHKTP